MGDNRQLSSQDDVARRMRDYDLVYQQTLYRQVAYALGEKWRGGLPGIRSMNGGDFPVFPDMQPTFLRVGQSRRILNTAFIGMARVLHAEPEPESPQVDKWKGEVRKQFYLERHRAGEWGEAYASAFLDAEATGVGCIQVGMGINDGTGFPKVDIQHIHSYNLVYDRTARTPNRAKWAYAVHYMDIDDALAMYGKEAKNAIMTIDTSGEGPPMQAVRVFEYYDKGIGGKAPTRSVVLGALGNKPVQFEANHNGACLPFGFFVYFLPPGMRRPMGRIPFQMSTQEAINELEAYLRAQLKQPDFTVLDARAMNPQDLQNVISGKIPAYVRVEKDLTGGMNSPVVRVPSAGVAQALIALQDVLERQFTADSGTTEFDRGMQASEKRTLGENELVDARGGVQASWSELMAAYGYRRTIEKIFHVASLVDRDPVPVDVFGTNYIVNNPKDPSSTIEAWLAERSAIVIDYQKLKRRDSMAEQANRLAALDQIAPYVGAGIDRAWFIEERLKAIGETDPRDAMGGSDMAGQTNNAFPANAGLMPDNGQPMGPTTAPQPAVTAA